MKKIFSIVLAMLMVVTISFSAMAAEFVPSISDKGAPEIVGDVDDDGNVVIGVITDGNGNELSKEYEDCIIITPVRDADTSEDIPEDAKEQLKDAFDQLNKPGASISDLCPDLDEIVKDALGNNASADDLVVRDLFDISSVCDNIDKYLTGGDNSLKVTFRLPLAGNEFVTAMVYANGKWQTVPSVVNNGNGTVTVELNQMGAVAFLVPGSDSGTETPGGSETSPATGDSEYGDIILWGSVMGVSLLAVVVVLVTVSRRKKKADK